MVKKTKGMILEMPELFTHEELVREFGRNKQRMQTEAYESSKMVMTDTSEAFERFMRNNALTGSSSRF